MVKPRRSNRAPKHSGENVSATLANLEPQIPAKSQVGQKRGRKRKLSLSDEIPIIMRKKAIDGREIDQYCWVCHTQGQDVICNSCPRVFHTDCVKKSKVKMQSGKCIECQTVSVSGYTNFPKLNKKKLKELFLIAMQEALKDGRKGTKNHTPENSKFCKYFKTWPQADNGSLFYVVDLDIIIDKINNDPPYSSTLEFFNDIKWLQHNCFSLYGADSEITDIAQKLVKNFKQEFTDIEACPECYATKHSDDNLPADFFTEVCKEPHEIVWAKLRGSPFWPAKVLQQYNGYADIRYFGTHDKSSIVSSQCYRISRKSPNGKTVKRPNYKEAISELSIYVSNYENRFGHFYFYPECTPLDGAKTKELQKKGKKRSSNLDISGIEAKSTRTMMNTSQSSLHSAEDISENPGNSTLLSPSTENIPEPVAVCMMFTADDDGGLFNELNNQTELLSASPSDTASLSQSFSDPVASDSVTGPSEYALDTNIITSSKDLQTDISSTDNQSKGFTNYNTDLLPVITSTASECVNSSFAPEESMYPGNRNPSQRESSSVSSYSGDIHNRSSVPATLFHPNGSLLNNFRLNQRVQYNIENDEEIQVLMQKHKDGKLIDVLKSHKLVDAFYQLIVSNAPKMQRFFKECDNFAKISFVSLWAAVQKLPDESPLYAFCRLYASVKTKTDSIESENNELKKELKSLQKKYEQLKMEKEAQLSKNRDIVLKAICKRINFSSKTFQTEINKLVNKTEDEESKLFEKMDGNHKECQKIIKEKDTVLKMTQDDNAILKKALDDAFKKPKYEVRDVEIQTNLSDSPGNAMFTLKEVETMKKDAVEEKIAEAFKTIPRAHPKALLKRCSSRSSENTQVIYEEQSITTSVIETIQGLPSGLLIHSCPVPEAPDNVPVMAQTSTAALSTISTSSSYKKNKKNL